MGYKLVIAEKPSVAQSIAAALIKDGRVKLTGCWSEKTGKTYDATVLLDDDGQRVNFRLEFEKRPSK